jgi:hypothetical protein
MKIKKKRVIPRISLTCLNANYISGKREYVALAHVATSTQLGRWYLYLHIVGAVQIWSHEQTVVMITKRQSSCVGIMAIRVARQSMEVTSRGEDLSVLWWPRPQRLISANWVCCRVVARGEDRQLVATKTYHETADIQWEKIISSSRDTETTKGSQTEPCSAEPNQRRAKLSGVWRVTGLHQSQHRRQSGNPRNLIGVASRDVSDPMS